MYGGIFMRCEWCGREIDNNSKVYYFYHTTGFFIKTKKYYGYFCSLGCFEAAKATANKTNDAVQYVIDNFTEHDG